MAKQKLIVAAIRNYFGGKGDQGMILGEFRKIEFARRARQQMRKEAGKKGWAGYIGIFENGKFLEEL